MLATHDQFTHKVRNRLKTTVMGLGLVRLLQDAGRFAEARATLYSLENGFQGIPFNQGGAEPLAGGVPHRHMSQPSRHSNALRHDGVCWTWEVATEDTEITEKYV
jgi:hypothetical protein